MAENKKLKVVSKIKKVVKKIAGKAEVAGRVVKKAVSEPVETSGIRVKTPVRRPTLSNEEFYARVRQKAYDLYVKRNGAGGDDLADWYRAEAMVREEMKAGF